MDDKVKREGLEAVQQFQEAVFVFEETARGIRDSMLANGWGDDCAQGIGALALQQMMTAAMDPTAQAAAAADAESEGAIMNTGRRGKRGL